MFINKITLNNCCALFF